MCAFTPTAAKMTPLVHTVFVLLLISTVIAMPQGLPPQRPPAPVTIIVTKTVQVQPAAVQTPSSNIRQPVVPAVKLHSGKPILLTSAPEPVFVPFAPAPPAPPHPPPSPQAQPASPVVSPPVQPQLQLQQKPTPPNSPPSSQPQIVTAASKPPASATAGPAPAPAPAAPAAPPIPASLSTQPAKPTGSWTSMGKTFVQKISSFFRPGSSTSASAASPPLPASPSPANTDAKSSSDGITGGASHMFQEGFSFLSNLASTALPGSMTRGVPTIFQQQSNGQPGSGPSKFNLAKMTCLINTERARHGLRPLAVHTKLMEMARRHSNYQSAMRHMTHSDTAGSLGSRATQVGFSWNFLEENVASFAMSEEEAMKAWMASPSHRENILSRNVEFFGAAVSDGFWTQEFGNMMDKTRSPRVLEGCPSAENLVVYS